jgi:hypothetical protein
LQRISAAMFRCPEDILDLRMALWAIEENEVILGTRLSMVFDAESQNLLLSEQRMLLRGKVSWCLQSHTCVGVSLACTWQLTSAAREWKHALQHNGLVWPV